MDQAASPPEAPNVERSRVGTEHFPPPDARGSHLTDLIPLPLPIDDPSHYLHVSTRDVRASSIQSLSM
jgi:hypothetical protein